jgi:HK97 gp10 family phage protein
MISRPHFTIHGDRELIRKLKEMKNGVRKKYVRRAVTAAIRPIRMAAKANAPKDFGILKKRLTVKVKAYKSGNVFGMVSVSNEAKDDATGRRPSKYLHLVSLGTKPHIIRPRRKKLLVATDLGRGKNRQVTRTVYGYLVRHPGAKPNPFLQDAITSKRQESLDKFGDILRKGILAEAAKA